MSCPRLGDGDILARVVSDSVCMSTYKAASQGENHKRVPNDVHDNPIIVGHEFCGEILEVGARWQDEFKPGQRFSIQPALNDPDDPFSTPGYAFKYLGGDATYVVIPSRVMELGCLLPFNGDAFYYGSLAEPVSCIIGGFHVNYHTTPGVYQHDMGIREGRQPGDTGRRGPHGPGRDRLRAALRPPSRAGHRHRHRRRPASPAPKSCSPSMPPLSWA